MRVSEFLINTAEMLTSVSGTPKLDSELLLGHALKKDRVWLFTWPEFSLNTHQKTAAMQLINRRRMGEPVAYILGKKDFWSLSLKVSPSTLIPRPDTEHVVEQALAISSPDTKTVLDLGTGTGAIALALAKEHPPWEVTGVDCRADSVSLAQENARLNQINNAVFFQSDWFSALCDARFDLIVTNPPYIDKDDPHLQKDDVRFEPVTALIAAENGLKDIRYITAHAPQHLTSSGWLVCEHGYSQGKAVRVIFKQHGFEEIKTFTDLSGHERVTLGRTVNG